MLIKLLLRAGGMATLLIGGQSFAQSSPVDMIRLSSDGAGPSHIMRVGRNAGNDGDVIAIIDPLLSAIRIFEVKDATASTPLASRVKATGGCALPVSFRPWRIHALKEKISIESMPDPGVAGYLVKPGNMKTSIYMINRNRLTTGTDAFAQAASVLDTEHWNPASASQCGVVESSGGAYSTAPEHAQRGAKNPARTIVLHNDHGALAPTGELVVRSPRDGQFRLISARELEPTNGFRFVRTAEAAMARDGTINITQRVLAFSSTTRELKRELRFDPSTIRSKLGQQPIAILTTGEVLVMGKAAGPKDVPIFTLFSCGNFTVSTQLCDAGQNTIAGRSSADLAPVAQQTAPKQDFSDDDSQPAGSFNSRKIFENAAELADFHFSVDTSRLPQACRVIKGCSVSGSPSNFVPLRGVRLTRGVFERNGVPYAQAGVPSDVDQLMRSSSVALSNALANVRLGAGGQPGNLADGFENDLGIDCSGLVQIAWNGRASRRLSTSSLKNFESDLVCDTALPGPEYLKSGDAVNTSTAQVNHVMLFAAAMTVDGGNDEWLMLESSSSCDGVCWSVYDPSFFSGWQLRRAKNRTDVPCIRKRHSN
jgi:hypothetical protein